MAKTWLITGSSRGLGRELAQAVLQDGDNAVATARRPGQLGDLTARYGGRIRAVALDVTDPWRQPGPSRQRSASSAAWTWW